MNKGKFVKNTKYYRDTVFEWNLPTGTTCPFALECKVIVDRITGKFDIKKGAYRCYAASPERFPAFRQHRWNNFELVKEGLVSIIPIGCNAIRIHSAGDFFNQDYFDMWLKLAEQNPTIEMWAYTKSLKYWVKRINEIPENLIITASYGGREDYLIEEHNSKNVKVYDSVDSVPNDRPIDNNDDWARKPIVNFALLNNMKIPKKSIINKTT
jgi:hypothetical protein